MDQTLRDGEMRLVIKSAEAPGDPARLIPAHLLQRTFSTVLRTLKTADVQIHQRKFRSEFFVSHLAMGSNEIGVLEQPRSRDRAVDLVRGILGSVYRSEYARVAENAKLAKCIVDLGKAIDERYPAVAYFTADTIPLDGFFARQAARLQGAVAGAPSRQGYFVGSTIGSFDGTLGNIDYRGATWIGHLVLAGGGSQIECVFDKRRGEDAFNPFGNKRVSVRGRAIYTGDSALPERIEVVEVEEIPLAKRAIDIRGSLTRGRHPSDETRASKNFQ